MKKTLLVFLAAMLLIFCVFSGCGKQELVLKTAYDGQTVDLCSDIVRKYLNMTEEQEISAYLAKTVGGAYGQNLKPFAWESDGSQEYTIYFSENADFSQAVTLKTNQTEVNAGFFYPGKTYYWKVESQAGAVSKTDSFTTADLPVRYITCGLSNLRDIGGWQTEDGKTVAYGKIYRGPRINTDGNETNLYPWGHAVLADTLNIQTEIDLRTPDLDNGNQSANALDKERPYVRAPLTGYTYIFPEFSQQEPQIRSYDERTKSSVQAIFAVLSQEESYPVYIHCNAGADRTGTVDFLINGLLGVPYEDLTRSFELTSFSTHGARWRSDIKKGIFTDSGVMQDDAGNYVAWEVMYAYMMEHYGQGRTLSQAIEHYLLEACQVPQDHIDAVKAIMLVDSR